MLRKRAGKASQRRQGKESSAPKRRKIGEGNEFEESRRVEFVKIITSVGEKRKPNGENEEPSHTARGGGCSSHIQVTFSCSLRSLPKIPSRPEWVKQWEELQEKEDVTWAMYILINMCTALCY